MCVYYITKRLLQNICLKSLNILQVCAANLGLYVRDFLCNKEIILDNVNVNLQNVKTFSKFTQYDMLWASVIKAVPRLDKSKSGQMVSEKVKFAYFDVYLIDIIYHKPCEIIQKNTEHQYIIDALA